MSIEEAVQIAEQEYILIPKVKKAEILSERKVLDLVTAIICQEYGFTMEEIKSRSRKGNLPRARYRIFYIARRIYPGLRIRETGRRFGLGDENAHCTVIHGIKQIEDEVKVTPKVKLEIELLEKRVREELAK